ncbi:fluoride efflux transporter CrcB [Prevotella corporis]|uniref:fluoride efflux transporter CrcB n=1 Tax=Prevotella corporis TaxID=28128 RepID=UPI00277D0882|nr:fluoride efflux transporter CrcB [Prevotella corporis]
MLKGFLLVGIGSFLGGGLRFLVSRMTAEWVATPFPLATFAVNIIGCLVIGYVSGLPLGGWLSADTRLILTTGFCGGFTTFSTFMNENTSLMKNGDFTMRHSTCLPVLPSVSLRWWLVTNWPKSVSSRNRKGRRRPLADTVSASFSSPLSYRYATI